MASESASSSGMPAAEPGSLQDKMNKNAQLHSSVKSRLRQSRRSENSGRGLFGKLKGKGRFGQLLFFAVGMFVLNWVVQNVYQSGEDTSSASKGVDFPEPKAKGKLRRLPVCRDGAVLITDAAYGVARETALLLADQGVYVLAAVRTKAELKSFAYEERKGLEIIVADPVDPNEVAKMFYRIKQIKNDFQRPLSAVIINTADSVLDLDSVQGMREQYRLKEEKDLDDLVDGKTVQPKAGRGGGREGGGKKGPKSSKDIRNATAAELSEDDIYSAASLIDVPALDDGYKAVLKSSMRITQAALDIFTEADTKYTEEVAAAAARHQEALESCRTKDDLGLGEVDGVCYRALVEEKETRKKKKKKKIRHSEAPSNQANFGDESCEAGATGRILYMQYNFEGVPGTQAAPPPKATGMLGLLTGSKKPASKRTNMNKFKRGLALKTPQQARNMVELNAFYFPQGCGMHCSIKAALESYIDQLRTAVVGGSKARYGTYHVSEIAIPSKPYRSQKASRSKRGKAPIGVDSGLQMPQHFWEIDAREQVRKQTERDSENSGEGKGGSKKNKKSTSYSTMIDARYSTSANAAAHAVLGAYPKTVYSAGIRL